VATPTSSAPQTEDSQLVFMSHAPGAGSLPPRVVQVDESLAGKVLGKLARTVDSRKKGDTGRGSAGVGALKRALQANDQSKARKRKQKRERSVDETLEGASKHIDDHDPPEVLVGQSTPEQDPSFLSLLPGAVATPFRGWLVTLLHTLLVALTLFLLEISPPMGLAAVILVTVELLGFRTRLVQDACAGRTQVRWPSAGELGATILIGIAAGIWCLLPALGLGLGAWGRPAFETGSQTSLVARAQRLGNPKVPGEGDPDKRGFGHHTLLELEALTTPSLGPVERSSAEVTRDLQAGARDSLRALVDVDRASPLGLAARVFLILGFLVYPMTILCAVRLRSVYAAIYPPIVLRAALTAPGAYLVVLLGTLAFAAGAVAGAVLGLPALHAALGQGIGHLVWILGQATYLVVGHMVLAGLLGRVYRSHQLALGWD
jgi:hypothetical protein